MPGTQRAHFPAAERVRIAELGLLALALPEEDGGGGRPLIDALIVQEEFARANPLSAWPIFEASAGPARVIDLFGSEEQKQKFLPPIASGEKIMAISISEPDAGSAATDAATPGQRVSSCESCRAWRHETGCDCGCSYSFGSRCLASLPVSVRGNVSTKA